MRNVRDESGSYVNHEEKLLGTILQIGEVKQLPRISTMLRLDLWFLVLVPAEQDWWIIDYLPSFRGYPYCPPSRIREVIENSPFVKGNPIMQSMCLPIEYSHTLDGNNCRVQRIRVRCFLFRQVKLATEPLLESLTTAPVDFKMIFNCHSGIGNLCGGVEQFHTAFLDQFYKLVCLRYTTRGFLSGRLLGFLLLVLGLPQKL
ncbi:MAG: hypothetical protein DDT29_00978 [Dehalococcoidia bacterium]|nr:hypothetical protein [Bacillota bacterium]